MAEQTIFRPADYSRTDHQGSSYQVNLRSPLAFTASSPSQIYNSTPRLPTPSNPIGPTISYQPKIQTLQLPQISSLQSNVTEPRIPQTSSASSLGQTVHHSIMTDPFSTNRLAMAQDRIQYLMEEHRWLTDRCKEYYEASQAIEAKFDGLKREIFTLSSEIRKDGSHATEVDLTKFKERVPSLADKEELLSIIRSQEEILAKLKESKKSKKKADQEEEPRNLKIDASRKERPEKPAMAEVIDPEVFMRDFSTFGDLGSKPKPQEIKRRTMKTQESKNPKSGQKSPTNK
jgi:hypothetical protein